MTGKTQTKGEQNMRLRRWLVVLMALTLFASACGGDDDDDTAAGGEGGGENTGSVYLSSTSGDGFSWCSALCSSAIPFMA